ncbi:hypothetical protein B5K03_28835 [Rhizobium phaseoli]|nr:hypothetical protein B5K03_28835 [Rhizobium phaseoli]
MRQTKQQINEGVSSSFRLRGQIFTSLDRSGTPVTMFCRIGDLCVLRRPLRPKADPEIALRDGAVVRSAPPGYTIAAPLIFRSVATDGQQPSVQCFKVIGDLDHLQPLLLQALRLCIFVAF